MKITITPDYSRYTDFTPMERITLTDFAWARVSILTSLRIQQIQRDQLVVSEANPKLIESYNGRIAHLKWTIECIDYQIREIYAAYGRLN